MSSAHETFRNLLKQTGNSVTAARLAVFEALQDQAPLSMRELIQRVPQVDRASIYRAVELFEQIQVVQRLNIGWKYKLELTDRFTPHHHHLTCVQCDRTIAMNEHALERFIEELANQHGFEPTAHQIELQGICQQCRELAAYSTRQFPGIL
jgi:Fur family ferric uptake transcriptional regulator